MRNSLPDVETTGIYNISCSCSKDYVGQTARKMAIRWHEHDLDIINLNPRTGLSTHIIEEKHLIKKRRVLKRLTGNTELNVWEASFIAEEHWNKLNNENGNVDPVWSFLFHKWSKPPSLKFNVTENIKRLCENNDEFELPDDILDS